MRFVKQRVRMPIVNLDCLVNKNARSQGGSLKKRHGKLLPDTIRCIICGPSNCGKTNLLFNLLFSPEGLKFENIYIFSKSLYQEKYKFLSCVLESLPGIGYFTFSDNNEVPPPSEVKPNSIMVFDDVACEKQVNIKNYFSMGRHNNVDTFYICQTYSYAPKQLVRDNANMLVIFKQDFKNLTHIYNDHVNTDMKFEKFKEMCSRVWKGGKNKFVIIDKDRDMNQGRFRSSFDTFIQFN